MRLQDLVRVGAAALFIVFAGCNSSPPAGADGGSPEEDQGTTDSSCALTMIAVTPSTQNIQVGNTANLAVRITDCNDSPREGVPVSFAIKGDPKGSTISSPTATSDGFGAAQIVVSAGQQAATFQIEATASGVAPVLFQINVTVKPLGDIAIDLAYGGTKTFNEFQAQLFSNQTCANFDPFNLPASMQKSAVTTNLTDKLFLKDLAAGSYAVVVTAKKTGELLAWGCNSDVVVTPATTTTITVTLNDLPVIYSGVYSLDNHFDFTGLLPPSVATPIQLLSEATDDHELYNDDNEKGNGQYGLDPAAFLLDFVYRQICRWDCQTGETFDTCSQLNHPQGDMSGLYLHDFMSGYTPGRSLMPGMCSGLQFPLGFTTSGDSIGAYNWINEQVQNQIVTKVPSVVQNILQLAGDIASAFTKLNILSTLTLTPVSHTPTGNFTHVLDQMVLTVHDLSGKAITKQFALADAGLTNLSYSGSTTTDSDVLSIPKHSFQLSFGKLLKYVYLKLILPTLGYTSTAQMFGTWINCTDVGTWLSDAVKSIIGVPLITASAGTTFCTFGLQAAGAYIEAAIEGSTTLTAKLEIAGTCGAGSPLGPARLALTLVNGAWDGTVTEGSFSKPLKGTFTGTRKP